MVLSTQLASVLQIEGATLSEIDTDAPCSMSFVNTPCSLADTLFTPRSERTSAGELLLVSDGYPSRQPTSAGERVACVNRPHGCCSCGVPGRRRGAVDPRARPDQADVFCLISQNIHVITVQVCAGVVVGVRVVGACDWSGCLLCCIRHRPRVSCPALCRCAYRQHHHVCRGRAESLDSGTTC